MNFPQRIRTGSEVQTKYLASLSDKVTKKDVLEVFVALNQNGRPIEEAVLNHAKKLLDDIR